MSIKKEGNENWLLNIAGAGLITYAAIELLKAFGKKEVRYRCPVCSGSIKLNETPCPTCGSNLEWNPKNRHETA